MNEKKKVYPHTAFGKRLKEIREKSQHSNMKDFSKATNIKENTLYNYEQGRVFPPIDKFVRICKALDVTPSYLLLHLLELDPTDRDLIMLWKKIKELRKNKEGWNLVKSMILVIELYLSEKETAEF